MRGQHVHVKVWQPDWTWLTLRGNVHYHLEGVGFGMLFSELADEAAAALGHLIENRAAGDGGVGADAD